MIYGYNKIIAHPLTYFLACIHAHPLTYFLACIHASRKTIP